MKSKSKLKVKRTIQDWDGEKVAVDQVRIRRRKGDSSMSATVAHSGRRPSAVIDMSLCTDSYQRVRELGILLNSLADFMGDSDPSYQGNH